MQAKAARTRYFELLRQAALVAVGSRQCLGQSVHVRAQVRRQEGDPYHREEVVDKFKQKYFENQCVLILDVRAVVFPLIQLLGKAPVCVYVHVCMNVCMHMCLICTYDV